MRGWLEAVKDWFIFCALVAAMLGVGALLGYGVAVHEREPLSEVCAEAENRCTRECQGLCTARTRQALRLTEAICQSASQCSTCSPAVRYVEWCPVWVADGCSDPLDPNCGAR